MYIRSGYFQPWGLDWAGSIVDRGQLSRQRAGTARRATRYICTWRRGTRRTLESPWSAEPGSPGISVRPGPGFSMRQIDSLHKVQACCVQSMSGTGQGVQVCRLCLQAQGGPDTLIPMTCTRETSAGVGWVVWFLVWIWDVTRSMSYKGRLVRKRGGVGPSQPPERCWALCTRRAGMQLSARVDQGKLWGNSSI